VEATKLPHIVSAVHRVRFRFPVAVRRPVVACDLHSGVPVPKRTRDDPVQRQKSPRNPFTVCLLLQSGYTAIRELST